jgi:hypothetical protein
MRRPELDKRTVRFSFTYVAIALGILVLVQGLLTASPPVTVPYSRFLHLLDQGVVSEVLIGEDRIRFLIKPDVPLEEDLQQGIARQMPLAARWAGAEPERRFEATRLPGIDDNTLLEVLTQ